CSALPPPDRPSSPRTTATHIPHSTGTGTYRLPRRGRSRIAASREFFGFWEGGRRTFPEHLFAAPAGVKESRNPWWRRNFRRYERERSGAGVGGILFHREPSAGRCSESEQSRRGRGCVDCPPRVMLSFLDNRVSERFRHGARTRRFPLPHSACGGRCGLARAPARGV